MIYLIFCLILFIAGLYFRLFSKPRVPGQVLLTICLVLVVIPGFFLAEFMAYYEFAADLRYQILIALLFLLVSIILLQLIWSHWRRTKLRLALYGLTCICFAALGIIRAVDWYDDHIPTVGEEYLLWNYLPYAEGSLTASLEETSTLLLEKDLPVLDGATALYPVYSAFAKAVYPADALPDSLSAGVLLCSSTSGAYKALVDRKADIIFVAGPSEPQLEYARSKGVTMKFTPIGKEGFVFFVNSKNSVENLTIEQIKGIYSGEITDWKELGGKKSKIRAFQRKEGSGSQTTLRKLMGDKPLMDAPQEDRVDLMRGIVEQVADYKNYTEAIGYSFRFYSTEMLKENRIRLLKVEGAEPDIHSIADGSYPLSSEFYAVTLDGLESPDTVRFLEWMLSEQGQELIGKTGYVPLAN